jgi:signal transduction histidine kinase
VSAGIGVVEQAMADDRTRGAAPPAWVAGLPLFGLVLGLALAYGLAAWVSLALSRQPGSIAGIWYANALAAAVLTHRPGHQWPWLLAGQGAAIVLVNTLWGDPVLLTLSFVPANLAETALAATALRVAGLHRRGIDSAPALGRALLCGGLLPGIVGASLAWLTVRLPGGAGLDSIWLPWFEGAAIGSLSVLPLAMLLAREGPQPLQALLGQLRWWALLCVSVGMTLLAVSTLPLPLVYVTLPLLLVAVLLRAAGAYSLTLAVSLTLAAALDQGIFVPPPLSAAWQQLFVYMAIAAALLPGNLLAAALHDLRLSRERLAQRTEALARANESLEQFVRIASHDLREPLNTIAAFGGLLQQDSAEQLPPASQKHLALMVQGTERMRKLLDDILQFAQVQQQQLPPMQTVDLDTALAAARESLAQLIARTGTRLQAGPLGLVQGHPALLQLVLQNLIGNAIKFVAPGQTPEVRVRAFDEDGFCVLQVLDNGIGIDPQLAEKLFQPFQRLHSRRHYEGSGLGLALARQIVQLHGGSIAVAPLAEGGSCFTVRLPRVQGS